MKIFKKLLKSEKGMSLVEIMVVVAIIGGIAALVAVNVIPQGKKAKITNTQTQISNLMSALDSYYNDNGRYPSSDQGLEALVKEPTSGKTPKNYPEGGYLKKLPKDGWGNEFKYASPGSHGDEVEVWSIGPDEEDGTDDDVVSWESEGDN